MTTTDKEPEVAEPLPFYSDEALRKQEEAKRLFVAGQTLPLELLLGIYEPRTPPQEHELCNHCGADARPEGEVRHGVLWCGLCLGRGRDEDYETDDNEENERD